MNKHVAIITQLICKTPRIFITEICLRLAQNFDEKWEKGIISNVEKTNSGSDFMPTLPS